MASASPTIRQRRLATELQRLREAAGFTREDVAARLEWHATKVWRMENARSSVTTADLRHLLDLYEANEPHREALIAFARQARQKGWWSEYRDVLTGSYNDLEAQASMLRNFEPLLIPGLLQTEAYARTVIRAAPVVDPKEVKRRTDARMARQQRLIHQDEGPQLWVVIDEAAIRRPVGGADVMCEQLEHLVRLSDEPRITIQVIRNSAGAHPGLTGPFVILDFPNPAFFAPVVYLELAPDGMYLEETEQIMRYTLMFDHLRAIALGPAESIKFIRATMDGLGHDE
ncbi:transcriptional regulator [Sphaerisporangium melleum]|uniref:Transcriptional regulator n=1 Tax=Sphaerisporangium melleum TaxID=321316 RepID=A0A917QZC2_9ACTN|nr:helix-turn-helix transcriptional regulator [Sphaerisporangium melleum]GGK78213.1 transcriptional regulator [Sphaerisporangium melleum]GII69840.1 transcriptional regulator [Sphaerisporangium melleum]